MKIVPTIGRVMWYWPSKYERDEQPWPALVVGVWGDHMVNVAVFDHNGHHYARTSVPIVQDESPYTAGDSPYLEWMPYQVGQAKKNAE